LLLESDCEPIGSRYEAQGLHRPRNPVIYKHPLVVVNKACTKFVFADFDVLFQDDFQSICAPEAETNELLFLTAVLASPLAQYYLFHTTANIGIERDIARLEEILEIPFPLPEDTSNPEKSQTIIHSCAKRLRELKADLARPELLLHRESLVEAARQELYVLVCKYFEISQWEQQLISDTVDIFRPSSTPGALDSKQLLTPRRSSLTNRQQYSETFVRTFRKWSSAVRDFSASTTLAESLNLGLFTFRIEDRPRDYAETQSTDQLAAVLAKIRRSSSQNGTLFTRLRGFVFYEPDRVHILKPLARRHWTNTAALNDADEILSRMMEEEGWRASGRRVRRKPSVANSSRWASRER
jgi:hypothetical protein